MHIQKRPFANVSGKLEITKHQGKKGFTVVFDRLLEA